MSSLKEQLSEEMKEHRETSDFFKFVEGDNRIRLLTEGKILAQHFFGKGQRPSVCYGEAKGCPFHNETTKPASIKYAVYIYDTKMEKVQLAELPYSVISAVSDLQEDEDFAFEGYPMPYDVKIKYNKEESPKDMYKVIGSPNREEVSENVMGELAGAMGTVTPEAFVEKKKQRQMEFHKEEGLWLSEEKRAQMDEERRKAFAESVKSAPKADPLPTIEYPEEEINPDDIPFDAKPE